MSDEENGFDALTSRCNAWFDFFLNWQRLSWALTVIIAGGSAFVASGLSGAQTRSVAALLVAISAALQATLKPEARANAYREAWIILDLALKKYAKMPESLLDAVRKGENRIGDTHAEKPEKPEISSKISN